MFKHGSKFRLVTDGEGKELDYVVAAERNLVDEPLETTTDPRKTGATADRTEAITTVHRNVNQMTAVSAHNCDV